jgi:hypothetical protein
VIGTLLYLLTLLLLVRARYWHSVPEKLTTGLVALSGVAMAGYVVAGAV